MKLTLPIILCTAREGRYSEHVARVVQEVAREFTEADFPFIDVREVPLSVTARYGEELQEDQGMQSIVAGADGYILVCPEYNRSMPGEGKLFLDRYYSEYNRKVFGLCTVSNGPWGGVRLAENIRSTLSAFNVMVPTRIAPVTNVKKVFSEDGSISHEDKERVMSSVRAMLEETVWFAKALKQARAL